MSKERIEELRGKIASKMNDKISKSSSLSILMENYFQNRTSNSIEKLEELREELKTLDNEMNPWILEFENLHHHYFVVFSSEMLNPTGDKKSRFTFQTNLLSTIDCNIDTQVNGFDFNIINFHDLHLEFSQKLTQSYSNIRFERIVKIK